MSTHPELHQRLDAIAKDVKELREREDRRRQQAGRQRVGDHDPGTTRWQHNTMPTYNPQ